jgi:hypothetical protein
MTRQLTKKQKIITFQLIKKNYPQETTKRKTIRKYFRIDYNNKYFNKLESSQIQQECKFFQKNLGYIKSSPTTNQTGQSY